MTGVIIEQNKKDWKASAETGILYQEVLATGDWTSYLPVMETQQRPFPQQNCVTFSALNCIEALIKQRTGKEINLSERFTATMSGTTPNGNSLPRVLDSIRNDGWLLEEDWKPAPDMTWDTYYSEIPQELKDKAFKNLKDADWEIKYDWVNINDCKPDLEAIKGYLKQCPLQMVTSYGSKLCNTEHARMLYKIDDQLYTFDSVPDNNIRPLPLDYPMPYIMRIVVQDKKPVVEIIPPITKDLWYGMKDQEVKYLQQKLIKLKYLSKGLDTGYYGPITKEAVKKFQKDFKVANPIVLAWNGGRYVYSKTRKALNNL